MVGRHGERGRDRSGAALVVAGCLVLCRAELTQAEDRDRAEQTSIKPAGGAGPSLGVGAVFIPINSGDYAFTVEAGWALPVAGWDLRPTVTAYVAFDEDTIVRGLFPQLQCNHWLTESYAYGFGAGLGYADFVDRSSRGWNDDALSLGGYITPVRWRFGTDVRLEPALHLGAIHYFAHDFKPWGYVSFTGVL